MPDLYQLRIVVRNVSPLIWRRLLVRSDTSIAEFHAVLQTAMGWNDRYRHGETISTATAESTVNQVISKRMVKRQQMQWSQRGAHLLLQTRTRVLNDELEETFRGWYLQFRPEVPRSSPPEARPPGF